MMADVVTFRAPVVGSYITGAIGNVILAITNADVDLFITPDSTTPTNCTLAGVYLPRGIPPSSLPSGPAGSIYCSAIPMDRVKISLKCGLGVDSVDVQIYPRAGLDVLFGSSLQNCARTGVFDAATVDIFRVFWSGSPGQSFTGGGVVMFAGRVAEIDPAGRSTMKFTVNDFAELLNMDFPRNVYQPYCPFLLYGPGCGLSKASYTFAGTVASSPTPTAQAFAVSGISQANGYFTQGVLTFTSGVLNGLAGTVKQWLNNVATPLQIMPSAPSPGDRVTLYAGCDRTWETCQAKFSNGAMFGGQPFIPIPDIMTPPIVQGSSGFGK
jgi:uncharacterized phage protein (TIGR02218 family)